MSISHNENFKRLRPHHIFCLRFLPGGTSGRGEEFDRETAKIKKTMRTGIDMVVYITQGVDDLCMFCPDCINNRCENPYGDENQVLRWDARILQGLGISYGQRLTVEELGRVIQNRAPLDFCRQRCPWRSLCTVFEKDSFLKNQD